MEDTLYQFGVDLIFVGHVHAYERTHPAYGTHGSHGCILNGCLVLNTSAEQCFDFKNSHISFHNNGLPKHAHNSGKLCARLVHIGCVLCLEHNLRWLNSIV